MRNTLWRAQVVKRLEARSNAGKSPQKRQSECSPHRRKSDMADDFEQQDWVRFGVAAALSKQYAADQRVFLDLLAQMLESALPNETEIGRRGGLFSKKTVQRVTVQMGDNRYTLEDPGRGPLQATRTHIVRGIPQDRADSGADVAGRAGRSAGCACPHERGSPRGAVSHDRNALARLFSMSLKRQRRDRTR